jgi:hypothetical protein
MMRRYVLFALPALLAATPALATSTIHCTAPARPGLDVWVSVGNGPEGGVVQVRIEDGRDRLETNDLHPVLGRRHVDRRTLRFDIMSRNGVLLARLDTRRSRGAAYLGTLLDRGRTVRVRCLWDEDDEG